MSGRASRWLVRVVCTAANAAITVDACVQGKQTEAAPGATAICSGISAVMALLQQSPGVVERPPGAKRAE
jgi:hypothetical protein